jgi:SNF2 family DNA or RNA helicase
MNLNLKPYQDEGVKFLLSRQWAGLFLDMGLGKTVISLTAISALMAEGHVKKALIVAPIRVLENVWPSEIAKWDTTRHLRFINLNGVNVTANFVSLVTIEI